MVIHFVSQIILYLTTGHSFSLPAMSFQPSHIFFFEHFHYMSQAQNEPILQIPLVAFTRGWYSGKKKKSQDPDLDTFLPTEGFDSKPLNLDRIRKIMQVNLVFKSQTPYPLSTKKKKKIHIAKVSMLLKIKTNHPQTLQMLKDRIKPQIAIRSM